MPKAGIRRRTGTGLALSDPAGHEELARGSETELLLLLLHPDLGALRTFPLPLPVVDVPFELLHRDLALSTCHLYSSIAPKLVGGRRVLHQRLRAGRPSPSGGIRGGNLLLAYAVAHEAGHCMLGPGHSYAGLMRGVWNRNDVWEMSRFSLHLTKQEARKAVARLTLAEPTARR
jgi:hypothetical protein